MLLDNQIDFVKTDLLKEMIVKEKSKKHHAGSDDADTK